MKDRIFFVKSDPARHLGLKNIRRRRVIFLVSAQDLSRVRGTENIDVRTWWLKVFFAFDLKPLTVDTNGEAGVPSGLHRGGCNSYPTVWKPVHCICHQRAPALSTDHL